MNIVQPFGATVWNFKARCDPHTETSSITKCM